MRQSFHEWVHAWRRSHLPTALAAAVTRDLCGPGIYWHRTGPREHVVHIIRGGTDA
jgi:hypothetical protein